jgi:lambda repressor-like predicted transcriptional regulator
MLMEMIVVLVLATRDDLCACGPDYCLDDPRYPKALLAKKKDLAAKKYPADLIALLDRDGACVAAVSQAPDGFSIKTVSPTETLTIPWTKDDEAIARNDLAQGKITAYYKFNSAKALACCKEAKAEDRPDWDSDLGLSMKQVIRCTLVGKAIDCQ